MRRPRFTGQFRRDVKRMEKRGKDMARLRAVIDLLLAGSPLPARLRDHPLKGDWAGYRDLHVEPDWLLLYEADAETLLLARTGSHADLFKS